MRTLDLFRPSVGAFAVGMAQAALDAALDWATTRKAFGDVLVHQQPSHICGRDGNPDGGGTAPGLRGSGGLRQRCTRGDHRDAAMAKLFATETAQWVVDPAAQLHGARGLQRGHLLEHLYRDVRAPRIYEGASEVQRTIIARGLVRARQGVDE